MTNPLSASKVSSKGNGAYTDEGKIEIFFDSNKTNPLSTKVTSGKIGALIKTRNEEVTELRSQIDEMAHGLVHSTNAIHRRGYVNRKIEMDQQGNIINDPRMGPVTGINFFKEPLDLKQAANFIELSDEVKSDLNNISTGLAPNSPGDNRIAIAISKLQHEKILGEGSKTFEESYLQSVGKIGVAVSKSQINTEQSGGILAQAKSIKERISGVSLDEETTNLVKFQHAYDASAKMMKTADEMFDSVLGMLR